MIGFVPLVPRASDDVLRVITPGRISKPNQDPDSIVSQHEDGEQWLRRVYKGKMEVIHLGEQISGWVPDRPTMVTAMELIKSGTIDVLVATELREIYRNPAFHWSFIQTCVDNDVRVILIGDNVDTADENWETSMYVASLKAGMEVPSVRRRTRRKANFAFSRGGMVLKVKFGYRRLSKEQAKSGEFGPDGLRIVKLPEWTSVIHAMRKQVLDGRSPAQIARWLNDEGIPPGEYVESGKWMDKVVESLLRDPILSGQRFFRKMLHKHHFGTGKHRRLPNAAGAESKQWPELAHMTAEEQAEMIAALDKRRHCQEFVNGKDHVRYNVPRSDSLWPGQHARCSACGALMYRYGKFLKCKNALTHGLESCWNHVQADIGMLRDKMLAWLMSIIDQQPAVREIMIDACWNSYLRVTRRRRGSTGMIESQIAEWQKQAIRIRNALRVKDDMESLVHDLAAVERLIKNALDEKDEIEKQADSWGTIRSRNDISDHLDEHLARMVDGSFEFAELLRRVVPVFVIQPVQALDCDQVHPRAKLTMRFETASGVIEHNVVIDVFKYPEHVANRLAVLQAKKDFPKATYRQIAAMLSIGNRKVGYMTVKRALAYDRLMQELNVSDPYRELTEPPSSASRWKRRQTG